VTDFGDLDALERELGPSLRVALRRAAAEITEEHQPRAPWLSRNGPAASGARFDDAAGNLEVLEPEGSEVMIVDFEPAPDKRAGRRRWLVIAAAAAALVLIAGSMLVWAATNDDEKRAPAGPVRTPTTVAPTPANGLIAFVGESDDSGNGSEIYVVAPDGSGQRALTSTPDDPFVGEFAPAWSPDRRQLAFLRVLPGGTETRLVVMDPATGEKELEERIPLGPVTGAISVAWSPDARFIIVHTANGGPTPVIMDLRTETWIRMSPEAPVTAWSPDGNWLLVQPCTGPASAWCENDEPLLVPADSLGANEVFSYLDLPGVRALDITEWPDGFFAGPPTWHPDGSSVAIGLHRDETIDRSATAPDETSIHVLSIADERLREVIRDGYSPAWSPQGTEIAYLRLGQNGAEIWVARADGSQAHFVANSLTPPAWSPDGSLLVGLDADGLFTVRPDGTGHAGLNSFPRFFPDVATQLGTAVMGTGQTMVNIDLDPDW
jgi:WD40 repeat protein